MPAVLRDDHSLGYYRRVTREFPLQVIFETLRLVKEMAREGRVKKTYPSEEVMTPYERLKSLPQAESCLRPGVTFEKLVTIANQMSDNQSAERLVNARSNLFQQISRFANRVA